MSDETPVWVEVMEAGFGALLESKGFRRVSPRCYRLDGDGLYWESLLYRGPANEERSLRDVTGYRVPGLDDIHKQVHGYGCDYIYGGRRLTEAMSIGPNYNAWKRDEVERARQKNFWTRFKSAFRTTWHQPSLTDDVPFYIEYFSDDSTWRVAPGTTQEVSDTIGKLWLEHVWPWVAREPTLQDVANKYLETCPAVGAWELNTKAAIILHKAGHVDWVRAHLGHVRSLADKTHDEVEAYLRSIDFPYLRPNGNYLADGRQVTKEMIPEIVERCRETCRGEAREAAALAELIEQN